MTDLATLGIRADTRDLGKARGELNRLSVAGENTERKMSKSMGGVSAAFKRVAASAAVIFGAQQMARVLANFESSMSKVAAITGATDMELRKLRDTAKSLGSTTEFSASQAADAIKFLGMAGFSASQSMAAIPAVLDLATAASMDLASAADIASNIMSGFGIEAKDTANIADVLAAASSRANTDVSQLGRAMSTVAPISKALGISMSETAAAIGIMSNAGIQGERAGTALRGTLASLAGPTKQATDALAKYGLTAEDVDVASKGLTGVMQTLGKANISAADAMEIFGREAASGALAVMQASGQLKSFGDELKSVDGAAKDMATTMRDNLGGDFKGFMSAVEGLIIALGDAGLTLVIRGVVQAVTILVRGLTVLAEGIGSVTRFIGRNMFANRELEDSTRTLTGAMAEQERQGGTLETSIKDTEAATKSATQAALDEAKARLAVIDTFRVERIERLKSSDAYKETEKAVKLARIELDMFYSTQQREGGTFAPLANEAAEAVNRIKTRLAEARAAQDELLKSAQFSSSEYTVLSQTVADLQVELDTASIAAVETANASSQISFDGAADGAKELAKWLGISLSSALELARITPTMADEDLLMSQAVVPDAAARAAQRESVTNLKRLSEQLTKVKTTSRRAAGEIEDLTEELTEGEIAAQQYTEAMERFVEDGIGRQVDNMVDGFKGGLKSIKALFLDTIKQMIAFALKNKIMLSLGLGGTVAGGAAAAGGAGGGAGSLLGMGGIGSSFMGGMASVGSGLLSGGLGGVGTAISTAVGGITTGAGALSSLATAAGAIAAPVLAVAAVFSFFKSKTKLLDKGLQVTTKGLSTFVEEFKKIQKKKFWGLSKKTWEETSRASAEVANPIISAVSDMQKSIKAAAATLGVGGAAFNRFSHKFKLSLNGMNEEEAMQAIQAEFVKMGDAMASIVPHVSSMNELFQVAAQRYQLQNRLLQLQGKDSELLARMRKQELDATHKLNKGLLRRIHRLEDQRVAEEAAKLIADERIGLERTLLQLQGNTAELRRRELLALNPANRALQIMIWGLEDAKKALDGINENDFASLFDFRRAQGLAQNGLRGASSTPVYSAGPVQAVAPTESVVSTNNNLLAEIRAFRAEQRQLGVGISTNTRKASDTLRKFDIDGLPATRT